MRLFEPPAESLALRPARVPVRRRLIAIAGNPNAGKTTVFNALTGTRHKVANYPGVTVERKTGTLIMPSGEVVDVVDLPGCYSLAARSPEEQIAHDVLLGKSDFGFGGPEQVNDRPDKVVVVVDASNLKRNLFLTTQLRDLGIPIVVALNMMDIAAERGTRINIRKLSEVLGCPVIPLVARRGEGIDNLLRALEPTPCESCDCRGIPRFIDCLPAALQSPVHTLETALRDSRLSNGEDARGEALWLLVSTLEGDEAAKTSPAKAALARRVLHEAKLTTSQIRAIETSARYRYLKDLMLLSACVEKDLPHRLTDRLDRVLLHKIWGPVIFIGVMALVFQSIFSWATPLMNGIEWIFDGLAGIVNAILPEGLFKNLVLQGVIAGVGNVIVFLPQILLLFLFIGLLEDIGYMARAAFLMDRIMARVGLDGRAFLPLLSSFACAIPGIMATRTIASRKDRLVTILVAPLMSCSARLPVYTLVIGVVFAGMSPVFGIISLGGVVLMAMYLLSVTAGITVAAIFKRTLLKSPPPPLLLELPTYKMPSLKSVVLNLLDRARLFVMRAGTVILAATVILWALLNIPLRPVDYARFDSLRQEVLARPDLSGAERALELDRVNARLQAALVEHSLGGSIGKLLEPALEPLGFDWKIGIGIVASFAAREVFVSALAVVHGVGEADEHSLSLIETLREERHVATGLPVYTPLTGIALLVFFVLACQCISTVAIVRRETNSWRWPAFLVGYMTLLAWLGAFAVYQGGRLLGFS